jgi:hypothetical protein
LSIFEAHQHDGRVILPLLKTISLLIDRVSINQLTNDASFLSCLCSLLQAEEEGCKDIQRLTAIINVALGSLGPTAETEKGPLSLVCKMLMHPFPRIRRIAAENLYIRLLEKTELDSNHPALNLLLVNPWDGDEPEARVKEMGTEIAVALSIDSPIG